MPQLRITTAGMSPKVYRLWKPITSLGRSPDNDVVLADPLLDETHAQIHFDGRDFTIQCLDRAAEFQVGGKKRRKHRLVDADTLVVGQTTLEFLTRDDAPATKADGGEVERQRAELGAYRQLFEFSLALLEDYELPRLLEHLMDAVISVTSADKGFLILMEDGRPVVKVARNVRQENLADAVERLSDSILEKVVQTRKPLIISDALKDAEFANSMSVLNLKLSSVMCVPLLERSNLLGVLYVGNDRIAHLFRESNLEVLIIFAAQASLLVRNALLVSELQLDNRLLSERIEQMRLGEIIGSSAPMQEVYRKIQRVATTDVSVLVTGETGTGKELVAREIHNRSSRAKGPFITINCGAIPENLLESELFGHVRGAFTGAVATKIGKFQAASGGTLFLDEIGEMPLALQVKILRALQERVVMKVGDTRTESVDIRIIAATNRVLEQEIKAGRFREDLFYRLNVVGLHLPPLRERGEDIVVLAKYLLARFAEQYETATAKGLGPGAIVALRKHAWPGNIRELENRLKKAVILCDNALLGPADLGLSESEIPPIMPLAEAREQWQRDYIHHVLELNGGNRTKTARDLGVDPRTIFRHLEREGPDEPDPPGSPPKEGQP
jgi:transcriptional regulator with GAF, ATPase, and Fis domain